MKILITGGSGLVGSRFVELSKFKSSITAPSSSELDVTKLEDLKKFAYDVIINFAAYTNVSEGENQRGNIFGKCWKTNVDGVKNILNIIVGLKIRLIQISTGYVFSGNENNSHPYTENSKPEEDSDNLTWYGFTKAEAERLLLDNLKKQATIVRIIYPVRAKYGQKLDYLHKMLKLFDERKLFPLFTDTRISISFIDELCQLLDRVIETEICGVFHSASKNAASPFELCSYFFEKVRDAHQVVKPALFSEFIKTADNPVRYPQFSELKVEETEIKSGLKFKSWKVIIDELIQQGI